MMPVYLNPENITPEQLQPERGWRFLILGESPVRGDETHLEFWVAPIINSLPEEAYKKWTFRTRRPLPVEYLTDFEADAFEDPVYQWSIKHYIEQGIEAEYSYYETDRSKREWHKMVKPGDPGYIFRLRPIEPRYSNE
jgi:hypothetical protein